MTRDARPWTHAALFGALWGVLELSLGTVLHLGRVPMKGMVMGSLGLLCLVALRRLQPRPGVCLLAGCVAVFLKVFVMGGLYPGPLIGIAGEAFVVEVAFLVTHSRSPGAVLGGACALALGPIQMFAMTWVVAGPDVVRATIRAVRQAALRIGVDGVDGPSILLTVIMVSGALGAAVGWLAWSLAGRVARRLGRDR